MDTEGFDDADIALALQQINWPQVASSKFGEASVDTEDQKAKSEDVATSAASVDTGNRSAKSEGVAESSLESKVGCSCGSNEPGQPTQQTPVSVAKQGSIATLERRLRDLKAQSNGKVKPVHQTREWRAAQAKRRAQWIKDHPGEEVPDALKPRVAVPCPKGTRPRC